MILYLPECHSTLARKICVIVRLVHMENLKLVCSRLCNTWVETLPVALYSPFHFEIYWWGAGHGDSKAAAAQLHKQVGQFCSVWPQALESRKPHTGKALELTGLTSWQADVTRASLAKWLLDQLDFSCLFQDGEMCVKRMTSKSQWPTGTWDLNLWNTSATEAPTFLP